VTISEERRTMIVSRGFGERRRQPDPSLPPGQRTTEDFPVMSAGPTPVIAPADWRFSIATERGTAQWGWDDLMAQPIDEITTDIHCVTRWSKLGTRWRGVSLDHVLAAAGGTEQVSAMIDCYGDYTTNVPIADLVGGKAWLAFEFEGEPLEPEHGFPVRLIVPHLYFWKSAKWVRGLRTQAVDEPGFWEVNGYHQYGDPWREQRYW